MEQRLIEEASKCQIRELYRVITDQFIHVTRVEIKATQVCADVCYSQLPTSFTAWYVLSKLTHFLYVT